MRGFAEKRDPFQTQHAQTKASESFSFFKLCAVVMGD